MTITASVRLPYNLYKELNGVFIAEKEGNIIVIYPLNMLKRGASFPHTHQWTKIVEANKAQYFVCEKCKMTAMNNGERMEIEEKGEKNA